MFKKRYMVVAALTIVCVLLGSLLYVSIALAQKGKEPTQVEVTNLPLDEQGNLKFVSVPSGKLVTLCVNKPVSLPTGGTDRIVASCNISGWNYASVWWSSESTTDYYLHVRYRVEDITSQAITEWHVSWGEQLGDVTLYKPLRAPVLELTVASTATGQANITAYVYLSF